MTAPPDFNLAPLLKFPPELFRTDDRDVDAFVLSLALAFNDLKAIEWTHLQMSRHKVEPMPIDAVQGQISGFGVWASRMSLSTIHEVMEAIRSAAQERILERQPIVETVGLLEGDDHTDWQSLVAVAVDSDAQGHELKRFLVRVRGNVTFHYNQPKALRQAYDRFFFADPPADYNRFAFASLDESMEGTRFYFADAAAGRYDDNPEMKATFLAADRLRPLVAKALMGFLVVYISLRKTMLDMDGEDSGRR
jgi:hypothetical protein